MEKYENNFVFPIQSFHFPSHFPYLYMSCATYSISSAASTYPRCYAIFLLSALDEHFLIHRNSIQDSTNEKARKSIKYCQFMKLLNYSPMDTKLFRKKIHPQCTSISELNWIFLTQTVLSQHFPNYTSLKICTKFHSNFTLRLRVWQGPWFCGFPGG